MASYYHQPNYAPHPYTYPNGYWAPPQTYQAPAPVYPTYSGSPYTTVPMQSCPTSPVIPLATPVSRRKSAVPTPVILPPNPTATGVPVMLPGVLNSTFTPTTGIMPLMGSEDEEEEGSEFEEPIIPTLHLTPPPSPLVYTYTKSRGRRNLTPPPSPVVYAYSKSRRSHSRGRPRSHSASRTTTCHAYPVAYKVCCRSRHCDGRRCKEWKDSNSLILSESSGSSGASSSSASSYSPSCRRRRSSSSHRHRDDRNYSWRDYYPNEIYETQSRPEAYTVRTVPAAPAKARRTYFCRKPKPFTIEDWADKAASLAPLSQSQAKHFYPDGVELHPLLDNDTTSLFFSILDSKKYVTLKDGSSIVPLESHHATSPPLIKMEVVNFHEGTPVVLENPNGITLGEVVDGILKNARATVSHSEVRKWSDGRRGIVYQWHWYHRSRTAGMHKHLTVGDTFGGYTAFEGMMTAQKAKLLDSRARGLSHCTMVLCLGMDGCIPGLRPLSDFPR